MNSHKSKTFAVFTQTNHIYIFEKRKYTAKTDKYNHKMVCERIVLSWREETLRRVFLGATFHLSLQLHFRYLTMIHALLTVTSETILNTAPTPPTLFSTAILFTILGGETKINNNIF